MIFELALKYMKEDNTRMKRPHWSGYWYWDNEKGTIIMHTKDGEDIDIRDTDRVYYTMSNVAADDWIVAGERNTPEEGGVVTFGFDKAIYLLKRGYAVRRLGWNGKGMFIYREPAEYNVDSECLKGRATCYVGKYMDDFKIKSVNINGHIDMKAAGDKVTIGWVASQEDMLADDWTYADEVGYWETFDMNRGDL